MKKIPNTWNAVFKDDSWLILDENEKAVCKIADTQDAESKARLIALAPYMKEALKGVSELIGDEDLPDNGEFNGAAICDMLRCVVGLAK
ncbi:hypothetical protein ACFLXT_01945 [Chloroflexota bacterium]